MEFLKTFSNNPTLEIRTWPVSILQNPGGSKFSINLHSKIKGRYCKGKNVFLSKCNNCIKTELQVTTLGQIYLR